MRISINGPMQHTLINVYLPNWLYSAVRMLQPPVHPGAMTSNLSSC